MAVTTDFNPNASFANRKYVMGNLGSKLKGSKLPFLSDIRALWSYLNDKPIAAHAAIILFALGYFICPIDAIPDAIPIVGYADDALVIAWAVTALGSALDKYRS